jgi:O-antigen ligase
MDADHKREAAQVRKAGYIKFIIATLMGMLAFLIVIRSFPLPVYIYKKSMMIISGIMGCEWSKERIAGIMIRHITDDNGTMSDRTLIWAASIRQCTRTLRRFLIGISPLGRDGIIGVYDGRHDIRIVHAHNIYLEILRRTGILGFIPLMSLVICWSINMVRTFLTQKERMYVKWLYVSVFGILIIGMAEPVAFMHSEWCYSGILVFMISGYLTGRRRLL